MQKDTATTHGLTNHPLYSIWKGVMHRCYHKTHTSYRYYGKRGIKVCDEWHDPPTFIRDIERILGSRPEGLSLDRINNDGNYEPTNVRWSTYSEQGFNRGLSKNNTSTCAGVSWNKKANKWKAQMVYNGKNLFFGYFEDFNEAVDARMGAEKELLG